MNEITWVWIGITAFAVFFEAITVTLVTIWFIPGAIVATILALLNLPLWSQLVAFFALPAICLIFFILSFLSFIIREQYPINYAKIVPFASLLMNSRVKKC